MYVAVESSTPSLIKCLISTLLEKNDAREIKRRCRETKCINKRLKSVAFEIILFGPRSEPIENGLSPVDRILAAIFNLRWESKYNEANQLEACVFKLKQADVLNNEIIRNVLSFLLFLTNEGDVVEDPLGSLSPRWQTPFPLAYTPLIPDGPLSYSCSVAFQNKRNSYYYTHYPRELFEKSGPNLEKSKSSIIDSKIFELPPGTNTFVQLPSHNKISDYLQQLSQTVYGALTNRVTEPGRMDVKLEIPELGEMSPTVSLSSRIYAKTAMKSPTSDDEGFTEPETPVNYPNKNGKNIWEIVLSMEPRKYYAWEDLGSNEIRTEKPYLTESGKNAINAVETLWQNELKLLQPLLTFPAWKIRTCNEILRVISYVMLGVSSATFWFSDANEQFFPSENNLLIGWSHQSSLSLLKDYALTGTFYYRLRKFSTELASGFKQGLIFRAFLQGLRRILRYYHALVLTLKPRDNILQFTMATRKIRSQLQNLAELCCCGEQYQISPDTPFPTGMRLLSYLYLKCCEAVGSDFYLLLLSLLISSSTPYLKFLHSWVYNGIFNDPCDEFPIKPSAQYMSFRDARYWSKAFGLVPSSSQTHWPLLSYERLEEIYICGKGVNLLKMCAQQHPLCTTQNVEAPELKLTFSKPELDTMHWKNEQYKASMKSLCKEKNMTWKEYQEKERLKKKTTEEAAIGGNLKTMQRIKKQIADVREAKMLEKRKQMIELQAQIKEVEERKKREQEAEVAIELKTKEQMLQTTEHYQMLKAKAEIREKRADWRARRLNMNTARVDFFSRDKMQIMLSLASLNAPKDVNLNNAQTNHEQIVTSESIDSLCTASSIESVSGTTINVKDNEQINQANNLDGNNLTDQNNLNSNTNNNEMKPNEKKLKRPEILDFDPTGKRMSKPPKIRKPKSKTHHSDSSGVGDILDWASEHSSESGREKTKESGRELVLRLISEESSGKDSGMSLQTPDEEKIETPMSTLSNTQSSDSVISSFISNEEEFSPSGLALINAGITLKSRGRSEHGHASESTLQSLMYFQKRPGVPELKGYLFDTKHFAKVRSRKKNVYGHASDSTIQMMMYGVKSVSEPATPMVQPGEPKLPPSLKHSKSVVTPYTREFTFDGKTIFADLMSPINPEVKPQNEEDGVHELLPLQVFVQQSLMAALISQILLVKSSVYNYFLVELKIMDHLKMLRSFLLLHDGEFARELSDQIYDKMALGISPAALLNPLALNSILNKAVNASLLKDNQLVKNFSFALPAIPHFFQLYSAAPFEGLELQYKVTWPINIIITSSAISKYNKIFRFLMQIRHAQWALNDVFYHLKRNVSLQNTSTQFTQLQLFRHEMQHFIRVLQNYISNQVFQVSWSELKHDMTCQEQTLDHLHDMHGKFLNRALYRCLLQKKAAPVMRIIQMIFSIILKFHAQMVSLPWQANPTTGVIEHRSFGKLCASYRIFREYSGFLYKAWLHDAVGTPSDDEIGHARVPATLERIFIDAQLC